jgi:FkbM family methyltransferase
MDGDGASSYLSGVLSSNQMHAEDYIAFRIFSDPQEIIMDIGANWGYSVASIWSAGAQVRIISFEPIVSYEDGLQAIKNLYPARYDFRMIGLDSCTTVAKFVMLLVTGVAIGALASASLPEYNAHLEILAKNIQDTILQWIKDIETVSFKLFEFEAQVKKLDDVLKADAELLGECRLAAIKIDVEGYECEVLKGAEAALRKHTPLVMLEGGNRHKGLPEFMDSLGHLYTETNGKSPYPVDGFGKAINGFFIHYDNIPAYQRAGIFDVAFPYMVNQSERS